MLISPQEFVENNKKDFVIFQLGLSLEEAGNDSVKKSAIVSFSFLK
jgi:DNA primase